MAGLAGGLLGVGGGFLMVPLQMLWAGASPRRASGNSLAAIVPIAVVAAAIYYFGKGEPQLDLTVAVWVMIGSSLGSFVGSRLSPVVPDRLLRVVLMLLLVVGAAIELRDAVFGGGTGVEASPGPFSVTGYLLIALVGFVVGTFSGLTGVGGGILLVPALVLGFGVGQRFAQGTSLIAILPTAAIGAAIHRRNGDLDLAAAARLASTGVPASLVGAVLALWLPQRVLAGLFGVLLLGVAARIWRTPAPEARG